MEKPQRPGHDSGEKRKTWVYDNEARKAALTKVVLSIVAVLLGIIVLMLCVYIIIPSIISGAADSIDKNFALRLYESTLINPPPAESAEPVFVQPGQDKITAPEPRVCFAVALAENPDVVGRVAVEGLGITYLVTQSEDNKYYLQAGYNKRESRNGAVFLDYRCNAGKQPLKGHYILYGHSFNDGGFFYNLSKYKDKDVFYGNRVIKFDTLYEDYAWEVFSAYTTDVDFDFIRTEFKGDAEWLYFLNEIKQKSIFKTDTVLKADDVLLTLCTCVSGADNKRFVVHARLIKS